jgi:hypothetical protein
VRYTYIGAAKSVDAALFAAILEHLKITFFTFSFRMIYFRMEESEYFFTNLEKVFFVSFLEFEKSKTKNLLFFLSAVALASID